MSRRSGMDEREREALREMREDAESPEVRADFARSAAAQAAAERAPERGLEAVLELVDSLRALFGDPPVCREPWPERDFRL